jgi:hypothetical protein
MHNIRSRRFSMVRYLRTLIVSIMAFSLMIAVNTTVVRAVEPTTPMMISQLPIGAVRLQPVLPLILTPSIASCAGILQNDEIAATESAALNTAKASESANLMSLSATTAAQLRPTDLVLPRIYFPGLLSEAEYAQEVCRYQASTSTTVSDVKVEPVATSQTMTVTMVAAVATPKTTPKASPKPKPSVTPGITPETTPTAKPAPVVSAPADLEALFAQHAATHGVDPIIMKKIAQCESGMRPEATNGPYGGMFQFVSSTWSSNRKAMGKDPNPALRYNAAEAIETAAFKMGRDGYGAWPACSRKALASV